MSAPDVCLLVVAKAPVAGFAKTRLAHEVGDRRAARLAAAALLDTLAAVRAVPGAVPVVAMTGDLSAAERSAELARELLPCTVVSQYGNDFAARLANAHGSVGERFPGLPVFQIGMDTPQVSPEVLTGAVVRLLGDGVDAVLGPAHDGGWWGLGLRSPADAEVLRSVPMSRSDTGARTLFALRSKGLAVDSLLALSDVDTMADAVRVAAVAPGTRFARELTEGEDADGPASGPRSPLYRPAPTGSQERDRSTTAPTAPTPPTRTTAASAPPATPTAPTPRTPPTAPGCAATATAVPAAPAGRSRR